MSLASPQNREEFKAYIKSRLGAPVLEVNVADEQLDICINDGFQYFNERSHFYGTETGYLVWDANQNFMNWFKSHCPKPTTAPHPCAVSIDEDTGLTIPTPVSYNVRQQNNYITLPDEVVGVTQVLSSKSGLGGIGGGVIPPGSIFPMLMGGIGGDNCGNMGFSLSSFFIIQGYISLINFLMNPPTSYNWNQRTHRLALNGDLNVYRGGAIAIECMLKPSPDLYPDLWNDLWLKGYVTALVKEQWGMNLTKYNQVQMPGGITLNGDRILSDAQKELAQLRERFAMDFADPPTAIAVG